MGTFSNSPNNQFPECGNDNDVTLGTDAIALPPRPGLRSYAGDTVELTPQHDGSLNINRGKN